MANASTWWVRTPSGVVGPIPWSDLRRRITAGEVDEQTEVASREAGEAESRPLVWRPLAEVLPDLRPCVSCGTPGAKARPLASVTSFVVFTRWKDETRVLCDRCGARRALLALAPTGLLGWWGIPWGLIRTPGAVVRNVRTLLGCRGFPKAAAWLVGALAFLVPVGVVYAVTATAAAHRRDDREAGRERVPKAAIPHLNASRDALERGDGQTALREAKAAAAAAPDSWVAPQMQGLAEMAVGDLAAATRSLRRAVALNPDNVGLWETLLGILSAAEDLTAVEVEATRVLERWPKSHVAAAVRAEARALRGDVAGALEDLPGATRQTQFDAAAVVATARRLQGDGRGEDAVTLAHDAEHAWKGKAPTLDQLRSFRAGLLAALERYDEAEAALEKLDLDVDGLRTRRGTIALVRGRYEEAERLLAEAAGTKTLPPGEVADLALWRGCALLRLGRVADARETWSRAPTAADEGKPTFEQLSCAYLTSGRSMSELRNLVSSARMQFFRNDLTLVEAMRLESTGDRAGAVALYRRCVEESPGRSFPGPLAEAAAAELGR